MSTKKVTLKSKINTVFNTTIKAVKNTNEVALTSTESIVSESINLAQQWQNVTKKAIDGGFKLTAGQQDLMFEALEAVKGQYIYGKKRVQKLFA